VNSGAPEGPAVPAQLVATVVLLLLMKYINHFFVIFHLIAATVINQPMIRVQFNFMKMAK